MSANAHRRAPRDRNINSSGRPEPQGHDSSGKRQPYARQRDLQKAGEVATGRAELPLPQMDSLFTSGAGFSATTEKKNAWAIFGLGSGEITPMTIAAIAAGTSIFFIFGGCVLSFHDHPAWTFAVFLLGFLQVVIAAGIALHESATNRMMVVNEIRRVPATDAQIVVPATTSHAEKDVKAQVILPQVPTRTENPTAYRTLDGGEAPG
uniref:hypothetical protein n=1 Tax=Actinoplanes sp. CA-084688 TaxID=3239901 RepID=UPI003F492041